MSPPMSRRSLLEGSIAASLGGLWSDPRSDARGRSKGSAQVTVDSFNVKDYGARADGSTDDARAFQSAIEAASHANGVVTVPWTSSRYLLGSTINLAPNTRITGMAGRGPLLQLGGAAQTMFSFVGNREAQPLNVVLSHLTLVAGSAGNGVAIRVRNFRDLFLRHVSVDHFKVGVWSDWGIGLYLYDCNLVRNARGLQVGGAGPSGGIRGGGRQADPFMDTVVVDACSFAQNELDIHDKGSTRSLGGMVVRDCSLYEWYLGPVTGKYMYVRFVNRKGLAIYNNWFEGGQEARTFIYLGNYDHDGNISGMCNGVAIFANDFLQTGKTETVGVDVVRCEAATIFGNCYEFAPNNSPIRLTDKVGKASVGHNSYLTYPDRAGYANPIGGSPAGHHILDPQLGARIGTELETAGRIASAMVVLNYGTAVSSDAASGNFFMLTATDQKSFTIEDPTKPVPGQYLVYDIRNGSGGELGEISWGKTFRMAGPLPKPANGRRRTISFYYDGTLWVETARSSVDI